MKPRIVIAFAVVFLFLASCAHSAAKPLPAPKITSITFSAPSPLKAGDIITVDMVGTPGCNAAFAVKDFISVVKMKEMSQGSYRGTATAPKDKVVNNAPLIGYLGRYGVHAPPMQASRLITVAGNKPTAPPPSESSKPATVTQPSKLPAVKPEPAPAPAPKEVKSKPAATPATAKSGKIVLSGPADGSVVRNAIVVSGKADPGSSLRVEITYSNRLSGILRLAGWVTSQTITVDKNGDFKAGPMALDGPLATSGLIFSIKIYYADRADHSTVSVKVIGQKD